MIGTKDNSNLDKIFKNEDNKKNIIDYKKVITRRDRSRLAKAVAKKHEKLGDEIFNLLDIKFINAQKNK